MSKFEAKLEAILNEVILLQKAGEEDEEQGEMVEDVQRKLGSGLDLFIGPWTDKDDQAEQTRSKKGPGKIFQQTAAPSVAK